MLLVVATFFVSACGAAGVAPPTPTPTATPPGGTGSVSGTVGVSVTVLGPQLPPSDLQGLRTVWKAPPGAPRFVPDELLVKFRPGVPPAQAAALHAQLGTQEVQRLERIGVSVLKINSGESVEAVIAKYRSQPSVQYAELNYYRYLAAAPAGPLPAATPNDPLYSSQWHYVNIGLPSAWNVVTGSSLVVVAVIDSGILFSHPDLTGVTVLGHDFYANPQDSDPTDAGCPTPSDLSHGSHVAGTIAARTNNSTGVAGVNWGGPGKTKIMPLRVFGNYGGVCTATSSDIIDAIAWAMSHSARVINMSFGGGGFSQSEQNAVTDAFNTGVILFAAAGNESSNCSAFYPAAYNNVVGIAATNRANGQAWYSNFGSCVDLAAPGGDTTVSVANGVLSTTGTVASPTLYRFFQGTSMATPHAAGLAALLISKGVTGPANIFDAMRTTATDLGAGGYDPIFGWGLINAANAVGVPGANPMRAFTGDISGNTITVESDTVTVAANGSYLVTNALTGTHTAFAWQDTNGNGVIDAGDLYGSRSGVVIVAGMTTNGINFSVSEVPLGSTPITPTGVTFAPGRR